MNKENTIKTYTKVVLRILLGLFMVYAAIGHMSFSREEFQAQVPVWLPIGKDLVVILSGIAELALGLAMIYGRQIKIKAGMALALFYVLIFPGNINQYIEGIDAFGLDSDRARFIRLGFQPVLILWALWSADSLGYIKQKLRKQ